MEKLDVIGGRYNDESACPICFSNARTRLVHQYLIKEADLKAPSLRLLHIAPEYGLYLFVRKNRNIDYVLGDITPSRYAYSTPIERMDVTRIGHESGSFGAIICNHVLEHVEDDGSAMAELFRVLEPGGWAILQVPISKKLNQTLEDPAVTSPAERERRFGQKDHVRIYAMDYLDRLASVGFSVEVFDPLVSWGRETIEAFRLDPAEKIFVARSGVAPQLETPAAE